MNYLPAVGSPAASRRGTKYEIKSVEIREYGQLNNVSDEPGIEGQN